MDFYIEKLTATGPHKEPSSVIFSPGLNIICGASDTGKTAILKSIKFMFGGEKPFDKNKKGFNLITMNIKSLTGDIQLSREIGRNTIEVESAIDGIDSGTYDVKYNDKNKEQRPVIHKLWLRLMGCDKEPMIISSQLKARKHFTMTSILRSFYLNEEDITSSQSVILPVNAPASIPHFLSSMLFLITGNDYSNLETEESKTILDAKKYGMETYAHERIQEFSERKDYIEEELSAFDGIDVENEIGKEIDLLDDVENRINKEREHLLSIINRITELETQSAELELVLSRHKALESQYAADIKRLTFIVDGENITHSHPQNTRCPFCDGDIKTNKRTSYIEASKNELTRIMTQAKGLSKITEETTEQIESIGEELESLYRDKDSVKELINTALSPQAKQLKKDIVAYRQYLQLTQEYRVLCEISDALNAKLVDQIEQIEGKESDSSFKPRKYFPDNFTATMSQYAKTILEGCNYPKLNTVEFSLSKFDLIINGDEKSEGHGKGYRSFINTTLGLALSQYYNEHAKYNPGLFIVDTPQHGLNQGIEDNPKSMKYGLFTYLIEHNNIGQTIIVENHNHLPDIDFESKGVNVIDFTHDNYESRFTNHRYGFLIGVTN